MARKRKLTKEEEIQIVNLYTGGEYILNKIAKKYKTTRNGVVEILKNYGVYEFTYSASKIDLESAINDFNGDMRLIDIADKYRIDRNALYTTFKRRGLHKYDPVYFSKDDLEFIREHYPRDSWDVILGHFPNRDKNAIRKIAADNGIRRLTRWTYEETTILKENCNKRRPDFDTLMELLPNRSLEEIKQEISRLSLTIRDIDWDADEVRILINNYSIKPIDTIVDMLPYKTRDAVVAKAHTLKLKSYDKRCWTEQEDSFILDNYKSMSDYAIGKALNRTKKAVSGRRQIIGAKRMDITSIKSYTSLSRYLRGQLTDWKNRSMENCNWQCVATGSKKFDIHHLYSFNTILSKFMSKYQFEEKDLSDYTKDELSNITKLFLEEHDKYPLGVCVCRELHDLFHRQYSKMCNTPEQWYQFVDDYKNGVYNDLLKNKTA